MFLFGVCLLSTSPFGEEVGSVLYTVSLEILECGYLETAGQRKSTDLYYMQV
jgi:hypothetical protein